MHKRLFLNLLGFRNKIQKCYSCKKLLTCSAINAPVMAGTMKPVIPPMKLMIPKMDPAKFGAKSCGFCRLVNTAAPLMAILKVNMTTIGTQLHPVKAMPMSNIPGMT